MANVSVLLKLGGYLSLTSRQLQMLNLDTVVAASPGIVKGSHRPRLEEGRELECGLGWLYECVRIPVTILGGKWYPDTSVSISERAWSFSQHLTTLCCQLSTESQFISGVELRKRPYSTAKTFGCHLGRNDLRI